MSILSVKSRIRGPTIIDFDLFIWPALSQKMVSYFCSDFNSRSLQGLFGYLPHLSVTKSSFSNNGTARDVETTVYDESNFYNIVQIKR